MNIQNFQDQALHIDQFTTIPGQSWCIYGENSSGIDQFIDLLSGKLTQYQADILDLPKNPGILSFRIQQELFEKEVRYDDSDFLNRTDPGTLVRHFLPHHDAHRELLKGFGMAHCLDLGYRQLSSGQSRKLLMLCKLTDGTATLILQNPYDGLDEQSCHELNHALMQVPARGIEVIVSVNTFCDIPAWTSHLAIFNNGHLAFAGPRDQALLKIDTTFSAKRSIPPQINPLFHQSPAESSNQANELVFLRQGFAGYGGKKIFSGLDLIIHNGDHTLITGQNGSGKSTLLDMITGDNPKCYANDLRIFGKKRGTGESIWAIKEGMGIVSPTLHREHRIPGSALQVVLSGLYDSIGLYQKASSAEIKIARQWLAWIDLTSKADAPFRRLSFAEQRQVLITRALIKQPKLLILDEPTQGLDDDNRNILLNLLTEIAARNLSTILFVSHREDEHRTFFRQQIHLDTYSVR